MSRTHDETVAPQPCGVAWIEANEVAEHQVRDGRQGHRSARVTVAHRLDGVHGQGPKVRDGLLILAGPGVFGSGAWWECRRAGHRRSLLASTLNGLMQ